MIFGNNIIKEEQDVDLVDIYEFMIESTKEEQEFFNEFVLYDFKEAKCIKEDVEFINEGFIDTAKKYIEKFIKFVRDLFNKFINFIKKKIKAMKAKLKLLGRRTADSSTSSSDKDDLKSKLPQKFPREEDGLGVTSKALDEVDINIKYCNGKINEDVSNFLHYLIDFARLYEKVAKSKFMDTIYKYRETLDKYKISSVDELINNSIVEKHITNPKEIGSIKNEIEDALERVEEYVEKLNKYELKELDTLIQRSKSMNADFFKDDLELYDDEPKKQARLEKNINMWIKFQPMVQKELQNAINIISTYFVKFEQIQYNALDKIDDAIKKAYNK